MATLINFFKRLHRFASQNTLYPLTLLTVVALGLWVARVWFSEETRYMFLFWNLFLAWIPYVFALVALMAERFVPWFWLVVLPLLVGWLLFLPNAPYLVTDLVHLRPIDPVPYWYDIGFFTILGWTGCLLGIVSLGIVQDLFARHFGRIVGWGVALNSIALCGLGLYLGRVLRWNSWDAFFSVDVILRDIAHTFLSPLTHRYGVGFTIMFTAIVGMFYFTIRSIDARRFGLSGFEIEDTMPTRVR